MNPTEVQLTAPDDMDAVLRQEAAKLAEAQDQRVADALLPPKPSMASRFVTDLGSGVLEAPRAVARGGLKALDAAADGLRSIFVSQEDREANPTPRAAEMLDAPQSVTGGVVESVAQFVVGFVPALRVTRAAGLRGVGGAMVAGAAADFSVFDPHEERLSDVIERFPALGNPVTAYLSSNPSDTQAEGRFKQAVEGLIAGGVLEGLVSSLRVMRAVRKGSPEEAQAAIRDMEAKTGKPEDPFSPEGAARADAEAAASAGADEARVKGTLGEQLEMDLGDAGKAQDSPTAGVRENPTADPMVGGEAPPGAADGAARPKRIFQVSEDEARAFLDGMNTEVAYGGQRNWTSLRTDLIENAGDLAGALTQMRAMYRKAIENQPAAIGQVRTLETVQNNARKLADVMGSDPDLMLQRLRGQYDNLAHIDSEVLVYRDLVASIHAKTVRYAKALNDPTGRDFAGFAGRDELQGQFIKHVELFGNVSSMVNGIQTNIARSLNAVRLTAKYNPDLMKEMGNVDAMAARWAVLDEADTKAGVRMSRPGAVRSMIGSANELFINSILSSPKTHMVNMLSGAAQSAFYPAERMIAGGLRAGTAEGRAEFRQGALQYAGLATQLRDAMRLAARSFRQGDPVLDPGRLPVEQRAWLTAERFGIQQQGVAAVVNFLGHAVRLPSRFLMAQDELFKQLSYRSQIFASASDTAIQRGMNWSQFGEHVSRALDNSVDHTGRAVDEAALGRAREVTFSQDLAAKSGTWYGGRTFGEIAMDVTREAPFLQLVAPFIRTPTNIARFLHDRTPGLNLLRKQYAYDFFGQNGVEAQARARAQMVTGGVVWGSAVSMALDGRISGAGPSNPAQRKALIETGWRPFSVVIEDEDGGMRYQAYDRLDPFGSFFGIAATFAEIGGFMKPEESEQLALDLTVAMAKMFQNKAMLQGITGALGALAEPEKKGEKFVYGLAGSFVPAALKAFNDDPHIREVRSIVEAFKSRTPGLSEEVDPVRNILGEPVRVPPGYGPDWLSPIATSEFLGNEKPMSPEWRATVQDRVQDEIARQLMIHGTSITPPPKKQAGEIDLTRFTSPITGHTAYDRWVELTGTVEIGGQTLRQRLHSLIHSDVYRRQASDGTFDHDGSRVDLIRRVVGQYRLVAKQAVRKEDPGLDAAWAAAEFRSRTTKVQ